MQIWLVFVLVAACSGGSSVDNTPDDPCAAAPAIRAELEMGVDFWTPDHEDALTARLVAGGFGGLYLEQRDSVAIVLVDPSKAERAERQFRSALACGAIYANTILQDMPFSIVIRDGDYDAIELLEWRMLAVVAFDDPDISSLGIDRMRNRIEIRVTSADAVQRVERAVVEAGVPRAALVIEIGARPTPNVGSVGLVGTELRTGDGRHPANPADAAMTARKPDVQ